LEDGPSVAKLAHDFMRFHDALSPGGYVTAGDFEERWLEHFRGLLADPDAALLVAELPGEENIGGYCIGSVRTRPLLVGGERVASLEELFVRSSSRGWGVGRALLEACREWARAAGALHISLRLDSKNELGANFYRAHGFSVHAHILRADLRAPLEAR